MCELTVFSLIINPPGNFAVGPAGHHMFQDVLLPWAQSRQPGFVGLRPGRYRRHRNPRLGGKAFQCHPDGGRLKVRRQSQPPAEEFSGLGTPMVPLQQQRFHGPPAGVGLFPRQVRRTKGIGCLCPCCRAARLVPDPAQFGAVKEFESRHLPEVERRLARGFVKDAGKAFLEFLGGNQQFHSGVAHVSGQLRLVGERTGSQRQQPLAHRGWRPRGGGPCHCRRECQFRPTRGHKYFGTDGVKVQIEACGVFLVYVVQLVSPVEVDAGVDVPALELCQPRSGEPHAHFAHWARIKA